MKSYCQATYYGNQCSVRCIPNDDCTSSYTCNPATGAKVCSAGWLGAECAIRDSSYVQPICTSSGKLDARDISSVLSILVFAALGCENGGFCRAFNSTNQPTCCCPFGKFLCDPVQKQACALRTITGFTGMACQYLSTCTINVSCFNGGVCNAAYDPFLRTSYYVCSCAAGYVLEACRQHRRAPFQ